MKIIVLIIAGAVALSCNNGSSSGNPEQQHNASIPKTLSDTLYQEVMKGHDVGMAKMGEIARYQQLVKQKKDSLSAVNSEAGLRAILDSTLEELTLAEELMNRWMRDFEPDNAGATEAEKISFYRHEKEKIDTVNARIFTSLEKANQITGL